MFVDIEKKREYYRNYSRQYRLRHPEKARESRLKSYEKHREKRLQNHRDWLLKNVEQQKEYRQKNKERLKLVIMEWRRNNPERFAEIARRYEQEHRQFRFDRTKEYRDSIREKVITHYTNGKNCCSCCGESTFKFLTIDHINGGGRQHRRDEKISILQVWIYNHNFPEGFQILCFNCNCGRHRNGGICPHKIS